MKKITKLSVVLFLLSFYSFAQKDKDAVEKQVEAMISDWNSHEFKNIKYYTTKDVEWINIVGMRWKGQKEVQMAHQNIFDAIFKKVPFLKKELDINMVTNDVAIAYLVCHVGAFFPPDGIDHGNNKMPEANDILTLVYIKKGAKWLLASGQNTVLDKMASKNDPVRVLKPIGTKNVP